MDVSGNWQIFQGNGAVVDVAVNQSADGKLAGRASHSNGKVSSRSLRGRVIHRPTPAGTLQVERLELEIAWNDRTEGAYTGHFRSNGRVHGVTHDVSNPSSQSTFIIEPAFDMP